MSRGFVTYDDSFDLSTEKSQVLLFYYCRFTTAALLLPLYFVTYDDSFDLSTQESQVLRVRLFYYCRFTAAALLLPLYCCLY